tara:strand:- start:304 stop:498 length:195 start_codon:yes stop_codon:yes gene_type:complete
MDIKEVHYYYTRNEENNLVKTHYRIIENNNNESTIRIENAEKNRHYQEILEWVAAGNTITDSGA